MQIIAVAAEAAPLTTRIQRVVAIAAQQPVVEPATVKRVVAGPSEDVVPEIGRMNGVVASAAINRGRHVDLDGQQLGGGEAVADVGSRAVARNRQIGGAARLVRDEIVHPDDRLRARTVEDGADPGHCRLGVRQGSATGRDRRHQLEGLVAFDIGRLAVGIRAVVGNHRHPHEILGHSRCQRERSRAGPA